MKSYQLAFLCAVFATGAQSAEMKGEWTGKTHTIIAGTGGPHWPESKGTWDKPMVADRDITIRITGQDGRRFWGESVIAGDTASGGQTTTEPFIGTVTPDDSNVMMADTDGYFVGKLSGRTLSYCYIQAGSKETNGTPAVVTCNEVTKQ